jgi:hypothetical protein
MIDTPPRIEGDGTHRRRTSPGATGIIARVHALAWVDTRADCCGEVG